MIYPLNYLSHVGVMLYYKSSHHVIHTVGIGNTQAKQISKLSFQLIVEVCSLFGQSERERKVFFGGCKKWDQIVRLYPTKSIWPSEEMKGLSFCEI